MSTNRPYILKQTCGFQLQVCLSMYDLLVDNKRYRVNVPVLHDDNDQTAVTPISRIFSCLSSWFSKIDLIGMIVGKLVLSAVVIIRSLSKTLHGVYILFTNLYRRKFLKIDFIAPEKLSLLENTCWNSTINTDKKKIRGHCSSALVDNFEQVLPRETWLTRKIPAESQQKRH